MIKQLMGCGLLFSFAIPQGLAKAKLIGFEKPHKKHELIVTFWENDDKLQFKTEKFRNMELVKSFSSLPIVLLRSDNKTKSLFLQAQQLAQDPRIKSVEANTILSLDAVPSDPNYRRQWGMKKIKAPAAWDLVQGNQEITVGVIDTGIDYNHPDLDANIWTNPGESGLDQNGRDKANNGIDDDNNGYIDDVHGWDFVNDDNDPMDDHGHGTHCAGVIGAEANNEGVAGLNWKVRMVGLKFLSASGSGELAGALGAIEYAAKMGFDLTSNSWGGADASEALKDAILLSAASKQLFVAAAGNDRANVDRRPTYPAGFALDNMINVAASNRRDRLAFFSNYGVKAIHLAAPGSGIYSTFKNGGYRSLDGTSMAAPHVAGAIALVKSYRPDLTMAELKQRILNSVDPVRRFARKLSTGGRLNVEKALTME